MPLELADGVTKRIAPVLVAGYGSSTEAGSAVSYAEPGDDLKKIDEGYVGKPFTTVEVKKCGLLGQRASRRADRRGHHRWTVGNSVVLQTCLRKTR